MLHRFGINVELGAVVYKTHSDQREKIIGNITAILTIKVVFFIFSHASALKFYS